MLKVSGIHHVTLICSNMERTVKFYTEILGMKLIKQTVNFDDPNTKHFYFGDEKGTPGTIITYFEYPNWTGGKIGVGITHHIAFIVETEKEQLEFRKKLEANNIGVTPVIDKKYFKSIYFQDPDGVILEIATRGPGFAVDEDEKHLGEMFIKPEEKYFRKTGYVSYR